MSSHEMKRQSVIQGECYVTNDRFVEYSTVLGSCVAVCLYEPDAMVGGMNHFLLPGSLEDATGDMKYGAYSMELLINGLLKLGADRFKLEAKIFGGSHISASSHQIGLKTRFSPRNSCTAKESPALPKILVGLTRGNCSLFQPPERCGTYLSRPTNTPKTKRLNPSRRAEFPGLSCFKKRTA